MRSCSAPIGWPVTLCYGLTCNKHFVTNNLPTIPLDMEISPLFLLCICPYSSRLRNSGLAGGRCFVAPAKSPSTKLASYTDEKKIGS